MTSHPNNSGHSSPPWLLPQQTHNSGGEERRVGFEIEYGGIALDEIAERVRELFGGRLQRVNRFALILQGTEYGDFDIHVDTALLKDRRYLEMLRKMGVKLPGSKMEGPVEELLFHLASTVVPHEIVTPPIPLSRIQMVEDLRTSLSRLGAGDTTDSIFYAFGLHFNPESPDLEVATLLSYLRAFVLLEPWLREQSGRDRTRRLTPFIDDFPEPFVAMILDPEYRPDTDRFVNDYLSHNPTRNRSLDMLPILAMVRKEEVLAAAQEPHLVHPRPAYHYRLPDSRINDPSWSIGEEWNRWVVVDDLAAEPERIKTLAEEFMDQKKHRLPDFVHHWTERIKQWLS